MNESKNNFFIIKIKINIKSNNGQYQTLFFLNDKIRNNYEDIYDYLKNLYNSISLKQKESYLTKPYINFIYGNQFQMMWNYLLKNKIDKNFKYFLFSIFDKEDIKIKVQKQIQTINAENNFNLETYKNFIDQCDNLLANIFKENDFSLDNICKKNLIKNEFKKYVGVYLNGSSNFQKEIIQLFKYFTNNLPLSVTLLVCNNNTTSEEIISFLYRCILYQQHTCFCIARTECLSKENKTLIINIFKELFEKIIKMKSCLLIINNNLEDELCKSLFNLKYIKVLETISEIKKEKIEDQKLKIVYSDSSGVGKSTFIKSKANNEYIYFPVGGIFSHEEILERLKKLDNEKDINNKDNLLFHIDLYDTEQKSLMNDFLYFIIVTKSFGRENNIFYISRKIQIYIEIPNSFINFFEKFPILNLISENSRIKLELNKLPPLIVPDDIYSNVRIVSLFLKLLREENTIKKGVNKIFKANNKIDKNQIMFPNSNKDLILIGDNFDYNNIVINAVDENKSLTQKLCQKLIMDAIKDIKNPTYYQVNSFINVLASQLILFNQNYYLSPCTLINTRNFKNCKVRSMIVKKFIDLTGYFTKGAFSQLIKEQENIQIELQKKYEEEEKIQESNSILENYEHDSISFDKMDLSLVLFHGGNNSVGFSIITNKNPEDNEYKELLNLLNIQSYKNLKPFINNIKKK